jgi:hypothetical protein
MRQIFSFAFAFAIVGCGNSAPPKSEPPPHLRELNDTVLGAQGGPGAALPPDDAGADVKKVAVVDAGPELPADITQLAKNQAAPTGVVVDNDRVFWLNDGEGAVMRVNKGGGITEIAYSAAGPWTGPSFMVQDDKTLYFAVTGAVLKLEKSATKPTNVATAVKDPFKALAADAATVYWIAGANVMKASKTGGAASALAAMTKDATSVATDGKDVFWSTAGDGTVWRGGARGATALVTGADKPGCLLADDASLWFCSGDKIMKAPKAGGAASAVATADGAIHAMSADGTHVYYATSSGIGRAPKAGGNAESIAKDLGAPSSLAVDGGAVYWTVKGTEAKKFNDGALFKKAK